MEGLKVKHTAGPWWVDNGQDDGKGILILAPGADESNGIANVFADEVGESEAKANAHLIASAPELLEACKRALPWMGKLIASRVHEDCVMPNDAVRTMEMLEAYIAKAEGRS